MLKHHRGKVPLYSDLTVYIMLSWTPLIELKRTSKKQNKFQRFKKMDRKQQPWWWTSWPKQCHRHNRRSPSAPIRCARPSRRSLPNLSSSLQSTKSGNKHALNFPNFKFSLQPHMIANTSNFYYHGKLCKTKQTRPFYPLNSNSRSHAAPHAPRPSCAQSVIKQKIFLATKMQHQKSSSPAWKDLQKTFFKKQSRVKSTHNGTWLQTQKGATTAGLDCTQTKWTKTSTTRSLILSTSSSFCSSLQFSRYSSNRRCTRLHLNAGLKLRNKPLSSKTKQCTWDNLVQWLERQDRRIRPLVRIPKSKALKIRPPKQKLTYLSIKSVNSSCRLLTIEPFFNGSSFKSRSKLTTFPPCSREIARVNVLHFQYFEF